MHFLCFIYFLIKFNFQQTPIEPEWPVGPHFRQNSSRDIGKAVRQRAIKHNQREPTEYPEAFTPLSMHLKHFY